MEILTDHSLQPLNTFNLNVDGKFLTEVASVEDIREAVAFAGKRKVPVLLLGGGSNILFTRDFPGLVARIALRGLRVTGDAGGDVLVEAGAGENWDDLVAHCVKEGYGGLENLSLIPGSVGASPVQNIGAYGVEMQDHFHHLEFLDLETGRISIYHRDDCRFGYRSSIFKQELKGRGVVLSVTFRLSRDPVLNTAYGSLRQEIERMDVPEVTIRDVREAVIRIRRSKLPDPAVIGNAGSFFKNPVIGAGQYESLAAQFPSLVSYPQPDNTFKLAAGWLIEQCGWKGYRRGDAGVHDQQALVLVNHGDARGEEIFRLSEDVRDSVHRKFGVMLEREVNVL